MGRKSKQRREQGAARQAPFAWPRPADVNLGCTHCPWDEEDGERQCAPGGAFDPGRVARGYLQHESWAFSCVCDLAWNFPEACFELVKVALPLCETDAQKAYLAAGPLESLLGTHGERMIAAVEAEARRDPAFKDLLTGVWQHGMPDRVWARVLAASGRKSLA